MSNFVVDTFIGTLGTNLSSHTSDDGKTWSYSAASGTEGQLTGSGAVKPTSESGISVINSSGVPSTEEYDVMATITVKSVIEGNYCGIIGRSSDLNKSGYWVLYVPQAGFWLMYYGDGSIEEGIGSGGGEIPLDTPTDIKLEIRNSTKKLYVNGTAVISVDHNLYTEKGKAGIWLGAQAGVTSPNSGIEISNFTGINFGIDPVERQTLTVDDSGLYWSKNWYVNSNIYAKTNNTGAYFKTNFSGTYFGIVLDLSSLVNNDVPSEDYPSVKWSIDNKPWESTMLNASLVELELGYSLSDTSHTVEFHIKGFDLDQDRWVTPVSSVTITAIKIDINKELELPTILPFTALWFGDSITETINAVGNNFSSMVSEPTQGFAAMTSLGMGWEYCLRGFGSQSWYQGGNGGVPTAMTSYNLLWQDQNLDLTQFEYIFSFYGTGTNGAVTDELVFTWLESIRAAAPDAIIILILPTTTGNHQALIDAMSLYNITYPSDTKVKLLGPLGNVEGLDVIDVRTRFYSDTIHPNVEGHARISTQLTKEVIDLLTPSSGGGGINGSSILGMI